MLRRAGLQLHVCVGHIRQIFRFFEEEVDIEVLRGIPEIGARNGDCEHKFLCPSSIGGDFEAIDSFLDVIERPDDFSLGEGADHDIHEDGAE